MVSLKFVAPFTYYKASVLPMSVKQTNQLHNGKRNEFPTKATLSFRKTGFVSTRFVLD